MEQGRYKEVSGKALCVKVCVLGGGGSFYHYAFISSFHIFNITKDHSKLVGNTGEARAFVGQNTS